MKKHKKNLKNLFYDKFLGVLTKRGKKSKAKKIVDLVLLKLSKYLKTSSSLILYRLFF